MRRTIVMLAVFFFTTAAAPNDTYFSGLHWRMIGPFRGGRTVAVTGVPGKPNDFFMAPTDGGIWHSTDSGRTWQPTFEHQTTGSIGALAIAASEPTTIYAGSGEGLRRPDLSTGDGMYVSHDSGATWTHLGLRDAQQINAIAVDPRDSRRLLVAAMGHPYGPNSERGLYRSLDGGATFTKVLGTGDDVGAVAVAIDPRHPDVAYAALWASRNGPWNLTQIYEQDDRGGLFKTVDGGATWSKLSGGLPARAGRIGIAVSPADASRLYALVEEADGTCGVYRSNDAGASWSVTDREERVCGRTDDFAGITADPHDRDIVLSANTSIYRSIDAGVTWTPIKGAPGGDDYHTVWIDPNDSQTIVLGSDQGATISRNGGASWSSWYNQPTAQLYHVATDDRFPYRVYGGQQESGSVGILSRGNDGAITAREFHPVGTEEYGYVAPDPLHPWLIYGGKVTVYDERTGQTRDVSPTYDRKRYRFDRTNPLVWNRVDAHTLYLGLNVVFATRDGGATWRKISPDLTRERPGEPATLATFAAGDPANGRHRGVIYSLAPSYVDANTIWAGTDDGLVWRTSNGGGRWERCDSLALTPWSRVTQIDASHVRAGTAYVSVSRQRLDDPRPYVYRTRDGGRTWESIVANLPSDEPVNAIREDPVTPNLLYVATERSVYASMDDGRSWQSLRLNLPSTSIRDIVVHGDDLVVATHGRSFWILTDISPLRAQARSAHVVSETGLFAPAPAIRVRRDTNTDTPLPPEEPTGENPPAGAIIDYALADASTTPVHLTIADAHGTILRTFSSDDPIAAIDPQTVVPTYWYAPSLRPEASAGHHRFIWDLRITPPRAMHHDLPIAAIAHATPVEPEGPLVPPGTYEVTLTVGTRNYSRPLIVRADPRAPVSEAVFTAQYRLQRRIVALMDRSFAAHATTTNDALAALLELLDGADGMPTDAQVRAVDALAGRS